MAARENQGLQIALIIFVTLTVLLSLTTFVFFRNYQNEQQKEKDAQREASDATQAMKAAKDQRDKLVLYSGLPAPDEKKTGDDAMKDTDEAWKKDMAAFQALRTGTLPDDEKTYRKMIGGLQGIVNSQHTQLEKQAADLRDAKADFDRKTADYDAEQKKLATEKEQAVADYLAERAANNDHVKKLEESQQDLSATLQKRDKEMETERNDLHGKLAERDKSIDTLRKQLKMREEEMKDLHGKFAVNSQPNGKILWVDQRDNVAYINLGSDDLLHKRVTFAVFDQNTTDPTAIHSTKQGISAAEAENNQAVVSEAKRKGVLEVINITQGHMAECRILEDSASNPLLPGDVIYTPLWRPGQPAHFALVGFFDIEGKGVNDIQKLRELVRTGGGVIDAETDEKGTVKGAVSPTTRYVVEGQTNHEGYNNTGVTTLLHDADILGVEVIDMSKFLDMMGYPPTEAKAIGSHARPSEAGEPNNNFQPRMPQERNSSQATQTSS